METFKEDVQYIIMKNNLKDILPPNIHPNNSSKKDTNSDTLEKFSQLNTTQIKKLYELYKLDFELFGYDIDTFLQPEIN